MNKQIRKPGRPKSDNPATEKLPMIRVTPDQLENYKAAAEHEEKAFSAWVRDKLDRAAKRILK